MKNLTVALVLVSVLISLPVYSEPQSQARELQNTFHEIYENYQDSVVYIATERTVKVAEDPFMQFFGRQQGPMSQRQQSMGTGFILSVDGYVCTNHHVVAGAEKMMVRIDGKEYSAKLIGSDAVTDIALLKINNVSNLKPVKLGDSSGVQVGDWAIAIGNPFGLDRTFTVGVISAVARKGVDDLGMEHIQTDASINPGNSGGPLINLDSEVIGMNRMIFSQTGGSLGIGFAIPINRVKDIVEQLRTKGKVQRGFIGIQITPLTPDLAKEVNVPVKEGIWVASVFNQGPAGKAGIQPGDVIYTINGKTVTDPQEFIQIVTATSPGKTVKLGLYRGQRQISMVVQVGQRPDK
ncbi:MAG: trypsin-like peptidase domain-containing protein [Leptonema sp. (in: Bacteria)]|nr:trypsin-like peptidase domain-containing protein [Leptonema sp. (in: bacteria)]